MHRLHHHLCKKFRVYHRWHEHPLHPHVHWGVLGAVVLGVALAFVMLGWSEVEVANVQVAQAQSSSCTRYVATTGSDTNSGTEAQPWRTIQKAADSVNPGDVVCVKDGVYTDTNNDNMAVYLNRGGTADNWVTFRSLNKWGAVLDGQDNKVGYGWDFGKGAKYVRVENFEIRDFSSGGFHSNSGAQHIYIYGNHIHHIARVCSESSYGKDGIYQGGGSNYHTYDSNVWHDIGRLHKEDCNYPPGFFYDQNHDHGIYINAQGVNIINNVFYNFTSGWPIHIYGSAQKDNIKIVNNTFAFQNPYRDGHIIVGSSTSNLLIQNNIFYRPRGGAIRNGDCDGKLNVIIRNNVTDAGTLISDQACDFTIVNNRTSTDPRLVSTGLTHPDFHLQSGSPAIDAGTSQDAPATDFEGTPRPQGAGWDIGADEFGAGTTGPVCGLNGCEVGETPQSCPKDCPGSTSNQPPRNLRLRYLGPTPTGGNLCGNPPGRIDPNEQCDGTNLNSQTCQSQGFSSGTLACTSSCTFNTSQCTSAQQCTPTPEVCDTKDNDCDNQVDEGDVCQAQFREALTFYRSVYDDVLSKNLSSFNAMAASGDTATDDVYYTFQYVLAPTVSMYEATGEKKYLEQALEWAETMVSKAVIVDTKGNRNWSGAWASPWSNRPIAYQLWDLQGSTELARLARLVLTDPKLKSVYGARAQRVYQFVRDDIVDKHVWVRNGYSWFVNEACVVQEGRPFNDKVALLLRILTDLHVIGSDDKYRTLVQTLAECFQRRLQPYQGGLIFDLGIGEEEGNSAMDTSHANRHPWAVADLYKAGIVMRLDEVKGFANLLTKVIWNQSFTDPMFTNFIDGTNSAYLGREPWGLGQVYTGWVTLGAFDPTVQEVGDAVLRAVLVGKRNPSLDYNATVYGKLSLAGHLARNAARSEPPP